MQQDVSAEEKELKTIIHFFSGWEVSDPSMCPVDSKASCADPKALSCSFRGCGPLPQVPTTKATSLSYLGTHERSLAGGRTSLLCRAATELKLAVTLASLLDPDNIIVLDQEHVDDGKKEADTPDWCPTQNCFATGNAAFKVENNREEMTNCFIGGYRNNKYISNMFAAKPRCAKADSIVHDEARGFVWGDSRAHEDCVQSNGDPCPHVVAKGCPGSNCIHPSLPWIDPDVPGLIHEGCSFAKEKKVFAGTELRCPLKSNVDVVDGQIHVKTLDRSSTMEECETVDKVSEPCPQFYPRLLTKKNAAKKNAEKSHQFQIDPCQDGFKFLAMDNKSVVALTLYLAFDGSYLEKDYQLMRLYELEALEDDSKACFSVVHGLCGPNSISLSPPDFPELLLTDCSGKLHFRRELDFCDSKKSQCWQMDAVEIDEDEAERKFLVTPKEGRILAETKEELAASLEARIREKGFDEVASFSAPTILTVTCQGGGKWQFEDSGLKDADVMADLMRLPCMSTHECGDPPDIFIAEPPLDTKAEITVEKEGALVKYACQPDFLFDNKKDFPPELEGSCTNQTIFDSYFPYWVIPGIEYPNKNDLLCLNSKICRDIPQVGRNSPFDALPSGRFVDGQHMGPDDLRATYKILLLLQR